jgi:integrase
MVADADQGRLVESKATVGELLERWFETAEADFSPKTALETRGFLDRNLLPGLGHVRLAKLRAEHIDAFYRELRQRGGKGGRPMAPATVRRIHGVLRRALGQAVKWRWIAHNPAADATPPRVPVHDLRPPDPAGIARLFAFAMDTDPDLATFVILAAATGARRSELVALRWSDIDADRAVMTVARGIVMGRQGLVEKDTKTHQARRVSLDPTTMTALAAHRERALARAAEAAAIVPSDAFVFTEDVAGRTPWRPDSTTRAFNRLRDRAGLRDVRLHDLRHYVATRLLASGVDVRTVAGRLGHRNAATTLNVYSHFVPEADQAAAGVLGALFDQAVVDAGT